MRYAHIGCGKLGIAVVNAMMLLEQGNEHVLYEPMPEVRQKLHDGEFSEMLMVAEATGNHAEWAEELPAAAYYIVTAGIPRSSSTQSKGELYDKNAPILDKLLKDVPGSRCFIATNPPNELAERYGAKPLRSCTDNLRQRVWGSEWRLANARMLDAKGFTSYGPAVAIAKEVLEWERAR